MPGATSWWLGAPMRGCTRRGRLSVSCGRVVHRRLHCRVRSTTSCRPTSWLLPPIRCRSTLARVSLRAAARIRTTCASGNCATRCSVAANCTSLARWTARYSTRWRRRSLASTTFGPSHRRRPSTRRLRARCRRRGGSRRRRGFALRSRPTRFYATWCVRWWAR